MREVFAASVLSTSMQIFYCFDVIFSGVLGSVLCLQNQALCAPIICSMSGWKFTSLC